MIKRIQIKNFKAIKDTGDLVLNPISCFIGYNGSGKSSLLEALLTFKELSTENLDKAMDRWKGFDNIQYKGIARRNIIKRSIFSDDITHIISEPISIKVRASRQRQKNERIRTYSAKVLLTKYSEVDKILILREIYKYYGEIRFILNRDFNGQVYYSQSINPRVVNDRQYKLPMNKSLFGDQSTRNDIIQWQFLKLNPDVMGEPYPEKRTSGYLGLNMDGSNVAEYLLSIREASLEAYEGILDTMISSILPYAVDLQSELTSAIERKVYLSLTERDYKVPGWLLSSGTLRILAILSVLRHPEPAPVVIIEELENGLDPRTIHVVINEIRRFVKQTGSQVIFTTHSPYLLDLMKLEEIVFVEKIDGEVKFSKPGDNEELKIWAEKFSPGKLYTMSRFNTV